MEGLGGPGVLGSMEGRLGRRAWPECLAGFEASKMREKGLLWAASCAGRPGMPGRF